MIVPYEVFSIMISTMCWYRGISESRLLAKPTPGVAIQATPATAIAPIAKRLSFM
jgi:hypothetical protein